jgi:hypothetical protein
VSDNVEKRFKTGDDDDDDDEIRWVTLIELMMPNPNMANKLLHHPTFLRVRPIKSKTKFVVKYISGMTDLIGQTFAYVLVKFVRQLSRWCGVKLAVTSTTIIFA